MQFLKGLVVVMSVLIIAGTGVVVVTLYHRIQGGLRGQPAALTEAASFGRIDLSVPEGARVLSVETAGDRLVLHLGREAGIDEQVVVIDLPSGTVLGTIGLVPGP